MMRNGCNRRFRSRLGMVIVTFLICSSCGYAQFVISGKLVDSARKPVAGATLSLVKKDSHLIIGYDISTENGDFQIALDNKPPGSLQLAIVATGFHADTVDIHEKSSGLIIILVKSLQTLPNVTVKSRKTFLIMKPDTASYITGELVEKQDRTIEDVIKRVPGIDIDASGKISFNGKPVSNFYIDGDDLVSDRYGIATRSVRPEMVQSIQVINNHNPLKVLESAMASDRVAINLNLKDDARMKLMGDIGAATGTEQTYKGLLNLLTFKKQYKAINYVKTNNSGVDLAKDIRQQNLSDILKMMENQPPKPMLTIGDYGAFGIGQHRLLFNRSTLVSVNNSFLNLRDQQVKLNINYLNDQQNRSVNHQSVYILPNSPVSYDEYKRESIGLRYLQGELSITENKKNYYLKNTLSAEVTATPVHGSVSINGTEFEQQYHSKPVNFSNELILVKKRNAATITELNSYIQYRSLPEKLQVTPGLNDSFFNNGQSYIQLEQQTSIPGFFQHHSLSVRKIGTPLLQRYKTGVIGQWQRLESQLGIMEPGMKQRFLNDSFINRLGWHHLKIYVRAEYDYISDRTQLSLALPLSLDHIEKTVFQEKQRMNRVIFSPQLRWRHYIGRESTVQVNYQYNEMPVTIQESYQGFVLTNYLNLLRWNLPLVTNRMHSMNAGWTGTRTPKMISGFMTIGYSAGTSPFVPQYLFFNTLQVQVMKEGIYHTDTRYLTGGASKYFFNLHTTVSGKIQLQQNRYNQVQQSIPVRLLDIQENYSGKIQSRITKAFTMAWNFSYLNSNSRNTERPDLPRQVTKQWMQQAELNFFPVNNLQVRITGEQYRLKQNGQLINEAFFGDMQVRLELPRYRTELILECQNLTNRQIFSTASVNGYALQQTTYPLRPRIFMLSAQVHF
jgi:hypothetical protein